MESERLVPQSSFLALVGPDGRPTPLGAETLAYLVVPVLREALRTEHRSGEITSAVVRQPNYGGCYYGEE
jgi:hypothetical protein